MVQSHYDRSVNFGDLHQYAWQPGAGRLEPSLKEESALDPEIRSAVETALTAKQVHRTAPEKADFLLDYHVSAEEKVDAHLKHQATAEFMGLTYTLGTLSLRMTRGTPTAVIWEGSVQASIDRAYSAEERRRRLSQAINELLKKFPPKK